MTFAQQNAVAKKMVRGLAVDYPELTLTLRRVTPPIVEIQVYANAQVNHMRFLTFLNECGAMNGFYSDQAYKGTPGLYLVKFDWS